MSPAVTAGIVTSLVLLATLGILGMVYHKNKTRPKKKYSFPARDTAFDTAKTEFRSIKKPVTKQEVKDWLIHQIEYPYGDVNLNEGGTRRKLKKNKAKKVLTKKNKIRF